ncbi:MAG: Hydrogenase isoenzymes nickel incorporation protein HypB [Candidatus Dichloromethanomonas elyunquensis]|nr:MAG: Hydrogenase isoenzymes nickel incorporation protein HypB [Candidatus Dichloromethanomonas elyunquensis]
MKNVYEANQQIANRNRSKFKENGIFAFDLMGSPGAGKTSLLEATLGMLKEYVKPAVIEGDLSTALDAGRISNLGIPVIQINTNGECHLDARMIDKVLSGFNLDEVDLMIIENVGNLVCPAEFDLGEHFKVVVISVAEGADKPVKYLPAFLAASAVVINKTDLLPYCDVDINQMKKDILDINPDMKIFEISCRLKEGLAPWVNYILEGIKGTKSS